MKRCTSTILKNEKIAKDVYEMTLSCDTSDIYAPGQFVNIKLDGLYLRRPISICDYGKDTLTIIYKVVGEGTSQMSTLREDDTLDILVGLGNGFDTSPSGERPLLVGGGVGTPPLYNLAKKLISEGKEPTVILGFNKRDEVFYNDKFTSLCRTIVTTVDGSLGLKGFVTDAMKYIDDYTYVYTCGPLPMLKAVYEMTKTGGQFSFEERMGCGIGVCMGCTCKTKNGPKRICTEGPVLVKEEILF